MTQGQDEPTTDATSEQRLARSLGYPKTWHVVRTLVPDPTNAAAGGAKLVQDRIFAGDPAKNADLYYNHGAAFAAALDWVEGESTPYDDNGGQMLPRSALYSKGQEVEVLYDDGNWYHASIKKVTRVNNDIRYNVLYTEEDTYQNNVTEDEMRPPVPKPGKGKKSSSAASTKKRGRPASSHTADASELELASEMGLPEGWMAKANKNSRYVFRSPDGKRRFQSKKAVFEFLGVSAPPSAKKARTSPKVQKEEEDSADAGEEEDPPWRLDGHEFIGRRIRHRSDDVSTEQTGVVTGWISETDVDKAGDPGFVSEATGKPAALFHVVFDEVGEDGGALLDFQDFEEFELLDYFLDIGEDNMEEGDARAQKEAEDKAATEKAAADEAAAAAKAKEEAEDKAAAERAIADKAAAEEAAAAERAAAEEAAATAKEEAEEKAAAEKAAADKAAAEEAAVAERAAAEEAAAKAKEEAEEKAAAEAAAAKAKQEAAQKAAADKAAAAARDGKMEKEEMEGKMGKEEVKEEEMGGEEKMEE